MKQSAEGHRKRLRERYEKGGIRAFSERDALELLLTYAIPRRDVKAVAGALLEEFGSLQSVLSQPPSMLRRVEGVGPSASVLVNLASSITTLSLSLPKRLQVMDSPGKVKEYLEVRMGTLRKESLVALLLDSRNRLIAECTLEYGTVDRSQVHPRNLVEKVISTGATGVILVHNHPGGVKRASSEDITLTNRIGELGNTLGFRLLDHLIVASGETLSLREEGLINTR